MLSEHNMKYTVNDMELLRCQEHHPPKRAFLNFCYYNEIALMAGEPNIGKTALVQDIINGVNSGLSFWGEPLTDIRGKCIFVDLEQSDDLCRDRMQNAPEGLFKLLRTDTLRHAQSQEHKLFRFGAPRHVFHLADKHAGIRTVLQVFFHPVRILPANGIWKEAWM